MYNTYKIHILGTLKMIHHALPNLDSLTYPKHFLNISELPFSLSGNLNRSIHKILSLNLNTLSVSSTASLLSAVERENTTKSVRILALHHGFAGHPVMSMSNVKVTNHRRGLT